jgi:YebC/PmpR family DNA-binding regulatory protein
MAGHSKWKNIQHRKGAQDIKRGKIFTKIAVELTAAARLGGGNPDDNPRLRTALAKAKAANMSKDNWIRAIKKGTGEGGGNQYEEKTYEGYAGGGIAVIVESLTDNLNRTISNLRFTFSKNGGSIGTEGSVSWMFQRRGLIVYAKENISDLEQLFELALDNGAEDIEELDDQVEITCTVEKFIGLKEKLETLQINPDFCDLTRIADNLVAITKEQEEALLKLVDALEEDEDVQNVFHNADLPDEESE